MDKPLTISVPYAPGINGEAVSPQFFKNREHTMPFADEYYLKEIYGSRLVLIDDEWEQIGYFGVYHLKEDAQ